MVIIELFVYVSIISMMVVCVNVMRKRELFKKSDFLYFCVLLTLIISQIIAPIFSPILPQIRDSNPPIILICIGTILALALIYFVTRMVESSTETQEYARVSTLWAMFIALGMSFCAILIWLPETKMDLYRMPFALALCIGMTYYPPVLDRLKASRNGPEQRPEEHKEAVLNTATATGIEKHKEAIIDIASETSTDAHKEAVINLATESWRLAKVFELAITQLNVDKPRRYTSRIEWFIKKAEESLEKTGLRIVNLEGHPYDPGMAAAPVNLEEFDVDDSLEVSLMVEPIIMDGTVLVKRGKVSLRRVKS